MHRLSINVFITKRNYSVSIYTYVEVASDVISSAAVDKVGLNFRVKFGDPRSNRSQVIRRAHFVIDNKQSTMPIAL